MFCPKCGTKLSDDSVFCHKCGNAIIQNAQNTNKDQYVDNDKKYLIISTLLFFLIIILSVILGVLYYGSNKSETKETIGNEHASKKKDIPLDSMKEIEEVVTQNSAAEEAEDISYDKEKANYDLTLDEVNSSLRKIDEALGSYIWVELMEDRLYVAGDCLKCDLSDAEMIRASVLASKVDGKIDDTFKYEDGKIEIDRSLEYGPNGDGYHGQSVPSEEVEKNCTDLFGTKANWNELQTELQCDFFDAVKYTDDQGTHALILSDETESETDQESHEYRVTENGGSYIGEVDIFFGYWGELANNPGYSNYTITYTLVPNQKSKFGIIVSDLYITRIKDDPNLEYNEQTESSDANISNTGDAAEYEEHKPFYGIFCFASKDSDEAKREADKLTSSGFDGHVYVSCDWEKLNPEKWYVVTAKVFSEKGEAEAALETVQRAGYKSAYVKFSGNYVGK